MLPLPLKLNELSNFDAPSSAVAVGNMFISGHMQAANSIAAAAVHIINVFRIIILLLSMNSLIQRRQ